MAVNGPTITSAPVEWANPAARDTSTRTPNRIDAHRPGRGRPNPRRAIMDFHGSRSTIAKPLVACRTSDHRAGADAKAKASQPVRNAAASRTSRTKFVRAPTRVGTVIPTAESCALSRLDRRRGGGYWVLQNCEKPELVGPVSCPSPPSSFASAEIQFTPPLEAKWWSNAPNAPCPASQLAAAAGGWL